MKSSSLELKFEMLLKTDYARGIPKSVRELQFNPLRRWRFDFAWPKSKVAVELAGGLFVFGGHTRPMARIAEMDKKNSATLLHWKVLEFSNKHLEDRPMECLELLRKCLGYA